jgi:hypothetical protein
MFKGEGIDDNVKKHTEIITFVRGGSTEVYPSNRTEPTLPWSPGFGLGDPSEFGGKVAVEETGCMFRIVSTGNEEFSEDGFMILIMIQKLLTDLSIRIECDRLHIWEVEL